jgi:hypothetical protein
LPEAVDQQKTADLSVVPKQDAIGEYDAAFIPIAGALAATFRVAGETELADRIRPTIRRLTLKAPLTSRGEGGREGVRLARPLCCSSPLHAPSPYRHRG